MGLSYRGVTIIGVKVSYDRMYEVFLEKFQKAGCEHNPTTKFCGECGKPATLLDDEHDTFEEWTNLEKFKGYPVHLDWESEVAYLGLVTHSNWHNEDYEPDFLPIDFDLLEYRQAMLDSLVPLGVWDGEKFGVHTFLEVI